MARRFHCRRAATLLETLVAMVITIAAMGLAAQTIALSATQQRVAERREVATQEAANVMERLFATSWGDLDQAAADTVELSACARQRLPNAELHVEIERLEEADAPPARQIHVTVGWQTRRDASPRSVDLTAWKYASMEEMP